MLELWRAAKANHGRSNFRCGLRGTPSRGSTTLRPSGVFPAATCESEAVTIDVEKSEEPVGIWAEPALIQFARVGDEIPVRVLGAFADSSNEELTKSSKTAFSSADPRVATVNASGMVTAVGPGKTTIQARTPSSDYSIPVRVP